MTDSMDWQDLGDAKLKIVVALFEKEYPEERIKKVIRHCDSVDSAIEWLERENGGASAATKAATSTSAATKAAALESRRRKTRTQKPTEQPAVPPWSNSKSSNSASSVTSELLSPAVVASAVPADSPVIITFAVLAPQSVVDAKGLGDCQVSVIISGESIPVLELSPMEPDVAADWWAKAAVRWPQIQQDLIEKSTGLKRPVSGSNADGGSTPTKKPRAGRASPKCVAPRARPPATPQGASSFDPVGDEAGGFLEESSASATTAHSPSMLSSPVANGRRSSRHRGSWTPDTSPRAKMCRNLGTEVCEICCADAAPMQAVRLSCRHGWYCSGCMLRHAESRLKVGAAHVACPECSAPIAECNLRKLIPPELMDRLLARSLEQAVSSTADLWACPTPNCNMRVCLDPGEPPRLECTACGKESCLHCGAQPYHTGVDCEEHANRLRSKGAKKAVAKSLKAEESFREWVKETGSKKCPTCSIVVTKQNLDAQATQYKECHKMLCRNCNTRFCFKCLKVLTDTFSCGCSIHKHGFVDPKTGKRLDHFRPVKLEKVEKPPKPVGKPKTRR